MRLPAIIILGAALLAGCGGSSAASGCVNVYFQLGATKKQEEEVKRSVERDAYVKSVRFVSKEQALASLKRRYPKVFKTLTSGTPNPLPDSLRLGVDRSQLESVRRSLDLPRPLVAQVALRPTPCQK